MTQIKRKECKYPIEVTPEMKERIDELNRDLAASKQDLEDYASRSRQLYAANEKAATEFDYPHIDTLQRKEHLGRKK